MAKLVHFSHECMLTSPETVADGVCNICYKDQPVEFSCKPCNFDLCKACSKLPSRVLQDFHPKHPLEFCLFQYDRKPRYVVCSGCGNMSSGCFYECRKCEIYLDVGCALQRNIITTWDAQEILHYSHEHLLRRCRPGPDATGSSCLLCELPLSPSAICFGCVHCYSFVHERCIDLPREIQHPLHLKHPLRRLDFTLTCGRRTSCDACGFQIAGVPFSCQECEINLHLRCVDSLLRGLVHNSHQHKLYYVPTNAHKAFQKGSPCQICLRTEMISLMSYYHCVECGLKFHFECLGIPESSFKRSFHSHPLVCKKLVADDNFLEYCGVCETMIYSGYHAYSCEICGFLGHIECILREVVPSPLYLKDLYYLSEESRTIENDENSNLEYKLLVNDVKHIHVLRSVDMSELAGEYAQCNICDGRILGNPCKCETCNFKTHQLCAETGKPSRYQIHWNHPLTLFPKPSSWDMMRCDRCRYFIGGFYLLCRICNFMVHVSCALKGKHSLGASRHKIIGPWSGRCILKMHNRAVQVMVSRSDPTDCCICDKKLNGKAVSCMSCNFICHRGCFQVKEQTLLGHPLHSDHKLYIAISRASKCIACKLSITRYGYRCYTCKVYFHIDCIKAADVSGKIRSHSHNLYNFWNDDFTQACSVCGRPFGASFYGCIDCDFRAHVECVGFPDTVKNHRHQHTVTQKDCPREGRCSLCRLKCSGMIYFCNHCNNMFHLRCIMSKDDREAATEEEQVKDIYLMYLERDLSDLLKLQEVLV